MPDYAERRKYQRCTSTICKALMSTDGKRWSDIELCDISAGGLRFISKSTYDVYTMLQLNLNVYNMFSEFNMRFEGQIYRRDEGKGKSEYTIRFNNVNKYTQIQLDELIKTKVSLKNESECSTEDGIYTYMFIPRIRTSSIINKMRMLR